MKNTDNTENKKHGCFTPIDKLPDGASVIDPPKDIQREDSGCASSSGTYPKVDACKGKAAGAECCFWYSGHRYYGRCRKDTMWGSPTQGELYCSDLNLQEDSDKL